MGYGCRESRNVSSIFSLYLKVKSVHVTSHYSHNARDFGAYHISVQQRLRRI